jgi:Ca2+:H+ antiporter
MLILTAVATAAAIVLRYAGAPTIAVFLGAAIAILGLAALLGEATEELGAHLGHRGILNHGREWAEIVISIFALRTGLVELFGTSITGSIIGNLLLVFARACSWTASSTACGA